MGDHEAGVIAGSLESQLNDLLNFRDCNMRNQMRCHESSVNLESKKLTLQQELQTQAHQKHMAAVRNKVIWRYAKQIPERQNSEVSGASRIALRKQQELSDTFPVTLAAEGKFQGLAEVMEVSDLSLNDVSS